MKDESERPDLTSQMAEARQLLEKGEVRDALILAMEVLWRELDQLRDTLGTIQDNFPPSRDKALAGAPVEASEPYFFWPESPSRLLH